jgi:hypothetical protein
MYKLNVAKLLIFCWRTELLNDANIFPGYLNGSPARVATTLKHCRHDRYRLLNINNWWRVMKFNIGRRPVFLNSILTLFCDTWECFLNLINGRLTFTSIHILNASNLYAISWMFCMKMWELHDGSWWYCHVSGVPWRIITGSGLDDGIDWRLRCTISLNYSQYSAIADLHTFQFTVVHALELSVSSSRILATDLNPETITSTPEPVWMTWRRGNSWLYRDLNSYPSVVQPVSSRYTGYAISAHLAVTDAY